MPFEIMKPASRVSIRFQRMRAPIQISGLFLSTTIRRRPTSTPARFTKSLSNAPEYCTGSPSLQEVSTGILLLSDECKLLYTNVAGTAILEANDTLAVGPDGIYVLQADLNARFQEMARNAADCENPRSSTIGLSRSCGKAPYVVQVIPIAHLRIRDNEGRGRAFHCRSGS